MVSRALLPTLFLSHGGGPGFFMKVPKSSPFADISQDSPARQALFDVGKNPESYGLPKDPSAIVVVSAHWEESSGFHVYSVEKPSLIYDYYGFPPHTYELKYDAPGNPSLANKIVDMINEDPLLKSRRAMIDEKRGGFDHGVFLPLMLLYPSATIPIVQVSLHSKLNLAEHVQLGRVLSPLRQENVLIIGSGSATHPMAPGGSPEKTQEFMELLESIIVNPSLSNEDRLKALPNIWNSKLMSATHIPTAEHLMPLFVVVGAAQGGTGTELFKRGKDFRFMNGLFSMACYLFSPPASVTLDEEQKC